MISKTSPTQLPQCDDPPPQPQPSGVDQDHDAATRPFDLGLDNSSESTEQDEWRSRCPESSEIESRLQEHLQKLLGFVRDGARDLSFSEIEIALIPLLYTLGRLALALCLCSQHERLSLPTTQDRNGRTYRRRDPQARQLGTRFGRIRYWRTYMYARGGGYYPLDEQLKLPAGGFSFHLSSLMARLATKMSYAQSTLVLRCFLGWTPSHTTVERTVFGLACHAQAFFEQAPLPKDDGEVLVTMIDSKATPTITEAELSKRRGARKKPLVPGSPRHRGRDQRKRRGRKKRRKKGDKSKNGKMATLVVMYTLRRDHDRNGQPVLAGPLNKRIYASYAPKRHAFAVARREADRRGFRRDSGKTHQLVTDGDLDLSRYAKELFPEAIHTLDAIHAIEYLWEAGRSLHREGSDELEEWVELQRTRLYDDDIEEILDDLTQCLDVMPKTGPGNKGKRERVRQAINYLGKRTSMMNYKELLEKDLEISSGPVEGAIRHVIAQRFDEGGMRWIREGAEALLQLRCIEINGQWSDFMKFIHATGWRGSEDAPPCGASLQVLAPEPLPSYGL